MKIEISLVRKFIEEGCGDTDYIIWCLDRHEAADGFFDYEDDEE